MKNKNRKLWVALLVSGLFSSHIAFAAPSAPPRGFGSGGPGGNSSASISYTGNTEITSDSTVDSQSYTSSTGAQNSLLVSGGTTTITNPTISKTGDTSDENSDFYGTNASVLVYNGATLNITGGTVTTAGSHANGVFSYGTGIINIVDTVINTSGNNSGGIMVTGGGTLNAKNLTVNTSGNSSAAIRSDRGGGVLTVNGGTYSTSGQGSPAIYSTADITVENATLNSSSSEGIVVEGANSVTIKNTTVNDNNTTLNGQSETYKNIFLYQSQSGDAAEGTSYFTATDSVLNTKKGDTIYVTNTNSVITLTHNTITNEDTTGVFLRVEGAAWGTSGSNGGDVTVKLDNQLVEGDSVIDNISSLDLSLTNNSVYSGAINTANESSDIKVTLDEDSYIVLQGNTYITTLENSVEDNSNIYLNGYTLYVNGSKVSANEGQVPELSQLYKDSQNTEDDVITLDDAIVEEVPSVGTYVICGVVAVVVVLGALLVITTIKKRKENK